MMYLVTVTCCLIFFIALIWIKQKCNKFIANNDAVTIQVQKQPFRGVLRKRCSENILKIYRRTPIEISLRHGCSPVNLQHIFRTAFPMNTSGRLLLQVAKFSGEV